MENNRQRYEAVTKTLNGKQKIIHYKGYKGLIVQHPMVGHLCGYVVIPEGHILYQKDYNVIDVYIHGGLTYSGSLPGTEEGYCVGFDCAHAGDWIPGLDLDGETYKDITFVESELKSLINQIINLVKEVE